jgi:hypothetical protein
VNPENCEEFTMDNLMTIRANGMTKEINRLISGQRVMACYLHWMQIAEIEG